MAPESETSTGVTALRDQLERGDGVSVIVMTPNARDQRRRAVGAPLADRNLSTPGPVPASGVPTSADRCIA